MTPEVREPGRGINIIIEDEPPITGARIKVIGVGGGGGNAVNRMIDSGIEGIEFVVANTDLQALKRSRASVKIQLGGRLTKGLGAGADPEVGRQAALEDTDKIIEVLEGSDMVFVTTGLGGGTGTGGAPIVASLATELGALTVAVVTKPFLFEGRRRLQQAEHGLSELHESVDTVITIPNERLFGAVPQGASFRLDQSRFCRRTHHHAGDGHGPDGYRIRAGRKSRGRSHSGSDLLTLTGGSIDQGRAWGAH